MNNNCLLFYTLNLNCIELNSVKNKVTMNDKLLTYKMPAVFF